MSQQPHPRKIYVETTTRCNLRCSMCVKYMEGSCIDEEDMSISTFSNILPSLPYADSIILNGIGEPLVHPHLLEFIKLSRSNSKHGAEIGFQSNGLLIDDRCAENLIKAGLTTICLSIDELEETRVGEHSFSSVQKAANSLNRAKSAINKDFKIGFEIVLSKQNISSLPKIVRWAADNHADYIITTHLIQYDKTGEAENLFNPNQSKAIKLYEKYKKKAEDQGISLNHAHKLFRAFAGTRSSTAEKVLFADILIDVQKESIRFNLPELVAQDEKQIIGVSGIFKEAEEIAQKAGVNLQLPATKALDTRQCNFIEQGAVCISVNGDVTPCHFLWHSYNCHMFGESIPVRKTQFGNVKRKPLSEIWQKEPYEKFREAAADYEYAPCWSCGQGPCTELVVNRDDYAHDCHGSIVPCGHCQWSLGGIFCL